MQEQIETGVDKLISLIDTKKKISLSEAAKELGVPKMVLEEWVNFLEEKELISVEYKLATPYLIKREMTKKEAEKKTKEFIERKEGFIRKVDTAIVSIENEREFLDKVKEEFDELTKKGEISVKNVEGDLIVLERYQKIKNELDKDILKQQKEFQDSINTLNSKLLEKSKKYEDYTSKIRDFEIMLYQDKTRIGDIAKSEEHLKSNINQIAEALDMIHDEIKNQDSQIDSDEHEIEKLKKEADRVKEELIAGTKEIKNLIEKSKKQENDISVKQQEILKKVLAKSKEIDLSVESTKKIRERFDQFFKRKTEINNLINKITEEVSELEKYLEELKSDVKILEVSAKNAPIKNHIIEVEQKFKQAKEREESFKKELKRLVDLVKK